MSQARSEQHSVRPETSGGDYKGSAGHMDRGHSRRRGSRIKKEDALLRAVTFLEDALGYRCGSMLFIGRYVRTTGSIDTVDWSIRVILCMSVKITDRAATFYSRRFKTKSQPEFHIQPLCGCPYFCGLFNHFFLETREGRLY